MGGMVGETGAGGFAVRDCVVGGDYDESAEGQW
jgi:hypothetical protein